MSAPWARAVRPWLSTVALVGAWQAVTALGATPPAVLPTPSTVLATAAALVRDGSLPEALLVSLGRAAAGSAVGVTVGLALGLLAGLSRVGADVVDRPIQMVRTIPFTALTPLLVLWAGLGEAPRVTLVALATAVPMYLNTVGGVRGVDPLLREVAVTLHLGRLRTVVCVLLPGALPAVLVGLRHALGLAWVAVVVAETVNATSGVGHLLTSARTYVRTDVVLVCIAVYALLGVATDAAVRLVEGPVLRRRGLDPHEPEQSPREPSRPPMVGTRRKDRS